MRRHPAMVLPLLDQWERGLEIDDYIRDSLVDSIVPTNLQLGARALFARDDVSKPQLKGLQAWLLEEQEDDAEIRISDTGLLPIQKRTLSKQIVDVLQPRLDKEWATARSSCGGRSRACSPT